MISRPAGIARSVVLLFVVLPCILSAGGRNSLTCMHLNTSHGLSYIGVTDMCSDQQGNMWIGTGNGLNLFNGKTVERYFATEYPQLKNSTIVHVACDHKNRIWVLTANGNLTIIDEKRNFHRAGLYDQGEFLRTRWIVESQGGTLMLLTSKGHYMLRPDLNLTGMDSLRLEHFTHLPIAGFEDLQTQSYRQVFRLDDNRHLFVRDDVFYNVNYYTRQVEQTYPFPYCTALTGIGDSTLMVYDREAGEVKTINLVTGSIAYPFRSIRDQYGKPVNATFRYAEKINAHEIVLTTERDGIYFYDLKLNTIYNHRHHFADASSISANATSTICVHPSGWVFVTCIPSGVSYFNSREVVHSQSVFVDDHGAGYDGYITAIATRDNETYYIGTGEGLMEWNRTTNMTEFLHYRTADGDPLPESQEIPSILIDHLNQVWVSMITQGVIVLDMQRNLVRHITTSGPKHTALKMERVNRLYLGQDGYVWVCGRNGICRIHPATFHVDHLTDSPLSYFDTLFCSLLEMPDRDNIWVAIAPGGGVAHCHLPSGKIARYTTREGLVNNGIFDLGSDRDHNIYVGTRGGLSIIMTDGRIRNLTQRDGLLMDRVEGLLSDAQNRMWIGNDIGLACYTPADSSLVTFDARYGLSIYGFRVGAYHQMPNGEFAFGTPHGFQYFHPDSLLNTQITLSTRIHRIETRHTASYLSGTEAFSLAPNDRQVTFYFSTVDFAPEVRTWYQYQLEGLDRDWISLVDQQAVRYNALPAGDYTFKIRMSHNRRHWIPAENAVRLHVAAPFYQRWWFRTSGVLLIGMLGWVLIGRIRSKQRDQREQLETEAIIHYFASQINRHNQVREMLWDVAKHCISKLDLEECVIYLLDPERDLLVQHAAYGPKNPEGQVILNPIEIPVGRGITGGVAQSKVAEIVNDIRNDPRYIVDDDTRQSEIAVPILINDQVIGVIDSEHSQRNYFSQRHMDILTTIAALCANQIQRVRAEEDKQQAMIEVLKNKQKVTESRLQSLRLQMNPHFLFNALNSIQQMILANEEMVATRYLSRFSKLLRTILIHSDKEMVTLREELDILRLYVDLEAVRFKEAFTYDIVCDEEIDLDEVKIPTLLIQPFVENAIWHGLMHKEGNRRLVVRFEEQEDFLHCTIEDNGIGREKAREMKLSTGQGQSHTSKGIAVSIERLKNIGANGHSGDLKIVDLKLASGEATGTRVEIRIPIASSIE